jgi:hypothetical protein
LAQLKKEFVLPMKNGFFLSYPSIPGTGSYSKSEDKQESIDELHREFSKL